jgi:hypothetical protein
VTRRLHVAAFRDGHSLVAAAHACRRRGLPLVDAFTPHPVHGIDVALGIPRSRLPIVCFAGGFAGLALGVWFQFWSSAVDWPLNVGGKPFQSLPAFVPVAFELMVLFAGLSTALALFVGSRLVPGAAARLCDPRVTDDRYVLVVAENGATMRSDAIDALLQEHGAVECREELSESPTAEAPR